MFLQVHKHFKPEFLNRLSDVVIFEPLSRDKLKEVVRIQMNSIIANVADKSISLSVSDAAVDVIFSESYYPVSILHSFLINQDNFFRAVFSFYTSAYMLVTMVCLL